MDEQAVSRNGIVCWLELQPDGQLRLVMDDVQRTSLDGAPRWKKMVLFTWRDYDSASFLESGLPERELADIGLGLVSRLAAFVQTGGYR